MREELGPHLGRDEDATKPAGFDVEGDGVIRGYSELGAVVAIENLSPTFKTHTHARARQLEYFGGSRERQRERQRDASRTFDPSVSSSPDKFIAFPVTLRPPLLTMV